MHAARNKSPAKMPKILMQCFKRSSRARRTLYKDSDSRASDSFVTCTRFARLPPGEEHERSEIEKKEAARARAKQYTRRRAETIPRRTSSKTPSIKNITPSWPLSACRARNCSCSCLISLSLSLSPRRYGSE